MKYDHLLPPELPRNHKRPAMTDLDCYPSMYEGVRDVPYEVSRAVSDVSVWLMLIPLTIWSASSKTFFGE
jgi:hypothetical protein